MSTFDNDLVLDKYEIDWSFNEQRMLKYMLENDGMQFMRYFFKAREGSPMIRNWHHYIIEYVLQAVYEGKINRLIVNIAPGYSKCVTAGTKVETSNGSINVEHIHPGDSVYSHIDGKLVLQHIKETSNHVKRCVEVKTRGGKSIRVSYDHPVLTQRGWIKAEELKHGTDYLIRMCSELGRDHNTKLTDYELDFLTLMIFEGGCSDPTGHNVRFTSADKEVVDIFKESCSKLGNVVKTYEHSDIDYYVLGGKKSNANQLLSTYGLIGKKAIDKKLPDVFFNLSLNQRYRFLSLMFATDGYVVKTHNQLGITLGSEGLIDDIQIILDSCEVPSVKYSSDNGHAGAFTLIINPNHAKRLYGKINLLQKQNSFEELNKCKTQESFVFVYPDEVTKGLTYKMQNVKPSIKRTPKGNGVTNYTFNRLKNELDSSLVKWEMQDFIYDKVTSVSPIGEHKVYHLSVDSQNYDHQNFIANGVVVHNTEQVVLNFIARGLALNPRAKFIHTSYSNELVLENSSKIRDMIQSAAFQQLWPMQVRIDSKSKKKWFTEHGGGMLAASSGGAITGFRAGRMSKGFTGAFVCFPYEELVHTEHGKMKIGDIVENQINVKVWSKNLENGQVELQPIDRYVKNPSDEIVEVRQGDIVFQCTPDHKVYTENRGYVEAQNLLSCDIISSHSFDHVNTDTVNSPLTITHIGTSPNTYCLTVKGNHNLYVGRSKGALVSNCDDPVKPDDAYSEVKRTSINNRFNNTMRSRLAVESVPMIIIMQRIHSDDLTGYLLKGGSGDKWQHLSIPSLLSEEEINKPYPKEYTHGKKINIDDLLTAMREGKNHAF